VHAGTSVLKLIACEVQLPIGEAKASADKTTMRSDRRASREEEIEDAKTAGGVALERVGVTAISWKYPRNCHEKKTGTVRSRRWSY
jgi:hypothetical protein